MQKSRLKTALALTGALTLLTAVPSLGTSSDLEVVQSFDGDQLELPEGVSIDAQGDIFVTMGPPGFVPEAGPGWVKRVGVDGAVTTLAEFDDGAPAGIVANPDGAIYFARPNFEDADVRGVFRLNDSGELTRLPGSEAMIVPNGLAFDADGGLFVGESAQGAVWHIPADGLAEPWFSDPEFVGGCGNGEFGANGVALWQDSLYVANTERGLLVRIPILDDGSAGAAEVVAGDATNGCEPDAMYGMDGIAIDSEGTVYALLVLQNQLVRIDPTDGSTEILLTEADGLHNPASLAFGTQADDRDSLYISNYAVLPPVPEKSAGPAVLRYDVGVEGLALR